MGSSCGLRRRERLSVDELSCVEVAKPLRFTYHSPNCASSYQDQGRCACVTRTVLISVIFDITVMGHGVLF